MSRNWSYMCVVMMSKVYEVGANEGATLTNMIPLFRISHYVEEATCSLLPSWQTVASRASPSW